MSAKRKLPTATSDLKVIISEYGHVLKSMGDWDHPTEAQWTEAMGLAQAECTRLRDRVAALEGALTEMIAEADEARAHEGSTPLTFALCGRFRRLAQEALDSAGARGALGEDKTADRVHNRAV